jgi:bacterioferritin-associated ferredoxin
MYICLCKRVTHKDIEAAMADGVGDMSALQKRTGVATGCGGCRDFTKDLLASFDQSKALALATPAQ